MKILHVLYSGLGGHGNVFFSMVDADEEKTFDYEVLFYGIEDVKEEYIQKCTARNIKWDFAKKKPGIDFGFYKKIFTSIRSSKPDIIFLHGSSYIFPAKLNVLLSKKKCKIVVRETQANHLKTVMQKVWLFWSLFLATKIVCLTEEYRQQIKQKLRFVFRAYKVVVIPNGIDLTVYKPGIHDNNSLFVIGMQSRLVSIKDHVTLLKAMARLKEEHNPIYKNIELRIAGDGEFKQTLVTAAKEQGIEHKVKFTGMLIEDELVHFLQSLHIYVHASLGETMSTAIMQAMACRLPVIASDVNGINNMINDNVTGILVPPKDDKALADAMLRCIENEQLRIRLANEALTFAINNYSNKKMLDRYKMMAFK